MAKIVGKKNIRPFPQMFVSVNDGVYSRRVKATIRGKRRGAVVYRYLQFRDPYAGVYGTVRSLYLGSVRAKGGK